MKLGSVAADFRRPNFLGFGTLEACVAKASFAVRSTCMLAATLTLGGLFGSSAVASDDPTKQLGQALDPVIKQAARDHEISSVQKAATGARVTSTDRTGALHSAAHDRGAIDTVTDHTSRDAATISRQTGEGFTTIHEVPGPKRDTNEIYRNGQLISTKAVPHRATGEHIHVQPDFNSELHRFAIAPSTAPNPGVTANIVKRERPVHAPPRPHQCGRPAWSDKQCDYIYGPGNWYH